MINKRISKIVLNLLLNVADGLAVVALVFGGWNATNASALTGYTTIAGGIVLTYLSAGLWFDEKWKQIARLVLYLVAGLILFFAVSVVSVHAPLNKMWPVPLLILTMLVNLLLSWIRLQMVVFKGH